MDVKFPFEFNGKGRFGNIYRPIAKVTLESPSTNKRVDVWMIVDTGADHTVIPRHFAQKLRVSLEHDCIQDVTYGVGGEQTIYFYKKRIKARLGPFERDIPLAFFDINEAPSILGRLGFLETFDTEFLKKHVVVFRG